MLHIRQKHHFLCPHQLLTSFTSFRAETPKITEDLQPACVCPEPAQEPLPVALPHQPRAVRSERLPTERLPDLHPLSFDVVRVDPQRDASNHRRLPVLDAVVDHTVRVHSLEECRASSPVADHDASSPDTLDDEVRERLGVSLVALARRGVEIRIVG